jgi:CheY-like chemotaxis protein
MPVFISHSFENKPEFENVVDALERDSVAYWNPSEVRPGASLREQLRAAVIHCEACIFIATKKSVDSSWCGSELGAFWGAGKSIIVYLAEASLAEAELPAVLQGDVWERRISRVSARAKELLAARSSAAPSSAVPSEPSVAQLTVEQFEKLIVSAVSLAAANSKDHPELQSFGTVESAARSVAGKVLAGFQAAESLAGALHGDRSNKVLWVDDRPENNVNERKTMEAMGIEFALALSTGDALRQLETQKFAAIISDMGRKEGPREGYVLLEAVRAKDKRIPFFIYARSRAPEHQGEATLRGAQGTTNIASELVDTVVRALRPTA